VFVLGLGYEFPTEHVGTFVVDGHYTNLLRHRFTQFPGDPEINLLEDPFYSTDFKTKENLSLTWNYKSFGTTFYVERYGRTPNYASQQAAAGYALPFAGRVGTWTLANLEIQYEALPGLVLAGHINNIANQMPPEDNSYLGINSAPFNSLNYNPYGRSFYVEATYKYGKRT
jgi:outer membrane receptor for ferrienterochelin and colicin